MFWWVFKENKTFWWHTHQYFGLQMWQQQSMTKLKISSDFYFWRGSRWMLSFGTYQRWPIGTLRSEEEFSMKRKNSELLESVELVKVQFRFVLHIYKALIGNVHTSFENYIDNLIQRNGCSNEASIWCTHQQLSTVVSKGRISESLF